MEVVNAVGAAALDEEDVEVVEAARLELTVLAGVAMPLLVLAT